MYMNADTMQGDGKYYMFNTYIIHNFQMSNAQMSVGLKRWRNGGLDTVMVTFTGLINDILGNSTVAET